jgi:hypothetical protein
MVNSSKTLNVHGNSITGATYTVLNGSTNGASINADCNWHGIATCAGVDALVAAAPDVCPPVRIQPVPLFMPTGSTAAPIHDGAVRGFVPAPGNLCRRPQYSERPGN